MNNFNYPQINKFNSKRVLISIVNRLKEFGYTGGELADLALLERCIPVHFSLFESVINIAKEYRRYVINLQENFGRELFSYPSASAAQGVVNALQLAMLDSENEYINFYIHEIDFGEKWRPGMIVNSHGEDFPLTNKTQLWELLLDNIAKEVENYCAGVA